MAKTIKAIQLDPITAMALGIGLLGIIPIDKIIKTIPTCCAIYAAGEFDNDLFDRLSETVPVSKRWLWDRNDIQSRIGHVVGVGDIRSVLPEIPPDQSLFVKTLSPTGAMFLEYINNDHFDIEQFDALSLKPRRSTFWTIKLDAVQNDSPTA